MPPTRKLIATHQLKNYPHKDVAAHRLSLDAPLPPWCRNLKRRGNGWEVEAKDKSLVPAQPGDWVVAQVDENSMCILSDTEFLHAFCKIP